MIYFLGNDFVSVVNASETYFQMDNFLTFA